MKLSLLLHGPRMPRLTVEEWYVWQGKEDGAAGSELNVQKSSSSASAAASAKEGKEVDARPAGQKQQFWLIKSEPDEYPLQALKDAPNGQGFWDGIRSAYLDSAC